MNKIYKVIWSKVKHQYVVVSELTHSNGKQKSSRSVSLKNSLRGILVAVLAAGSLYINGGIAFAGIDGPQNPQTGMTQQSSDNDITIIIDEDMDLKLDEELAFVFNEKEDNPEDQRETIRDQTGQINFSSTGGTEGTNKQIVISSLGSLNLATDENGKYMFKHNNDNIEEDKKYVYVDPETKEYTYADGTAVPSDERGYYQPVWKPNFTEHILDAGSDVIGNIASSEQVQKNKDGSLTLTKPGEKPGETIKQEFTNKGSLSSVAINGEYYEIPDYALQDGQVAVGETETIYDKDGKSNPVEVQTGATFLKVADRNDPTKSDDVKVDGLVTYNTREDNKGNVTTDYGNITLAGYVEKDENGNIKYDEKGHPIRQGTLITNVKDGTIWKDSKDAVNGSQLYAVDQKVNAGWTAKVGETSINVRPNLENETGKDVLNFEAGDNIKLTPNADENKIKIAADGVVSYDKNTSGGYDTTSVTLGEEGNKYVPVSDDGKTPASGGVKLTNVAYASGNDKSEAVNVDYLEKYVDKNGGGSWNITANKNDENATSIGKGNTVDFSGDDNITVAKTDKADKSGADITVNLNDNITLGEGENQIQLNGAPKDDDTPAISVGNNFAVNHDGSITSTVANNAGGGAKADATFNFDEHGLSVKDNVGKTSTLIDGGTITVRNALDNQTVINGKAITAGDIKLNSENNASTMVGLSNTTWENNETWQNEHVVDNRAATEGQLKQAINNLETSTTGNEKHIATAADGEAHPQGGYTVDKEDHTVTLTEVDGNGKATGNNVVISGIASSDEVGDLNYSKVVNEGDDLTINDDDSVTLAIGKLDDRVINNTNNITKLQGQTIDGGYVKDGTINLTHNNGEGVDPSVIASVDGLEDYTLQDGQIITKETKIDADGNKVYTGATELTLADRYDPTKTQKVTIDGLVTYNTKSLKDDDGKVTTGIDYDNITLAGKNGTRIVNVTDGWIDEKSTDAVNGSQLWETQQQIKDVAGKHTTMTVNGGMTAPEDGSYTHDEEGRLDGNLLLKQSEGTNGQTVYDLKLNPDITLQSEDDKLETQDNRVELSGSNGTIMATTDFNDMSATTTINGGNVYVGNSVSVGDKVVMTNEDITGLSNTNWDGTTDNVSRAATEGQLKTVSDTVNAGWTATDSDGKSIVVNPENGSTLNFAGDRNIEVKANEKDGSIDVSLKDDIVLGGKEDTSRVEIGGTNGTIMATKDPNNMAATTTIDGGNVYVGSSISVGDKVEITDKDITGLSNTSWNGTTDDESRAATEGQLKDVSDTVNAGWTATDSNGNSIVVNPENESTLNFAGDRNIDVKANKEDSSIDVSLDDDIVLGGKEGTSRVEIGGTNGTIMATKDPNSMVATTTIDGGNVYVGSSISVGDKVEITDKDITGLSNTEWNGTTTTPDRAATEGQLQDVAIEAAKHTTVSGDKNITVKHEEDSQDYQVTLNDKVYLGGDHTEDSHNIVLDGDRGVIGLGSTIALDGRDGTAVIGGVNITTTSEEETGKAVSTITGLSNTTWEGTTETPDRAATEGQLQSVATEAAKHTTVSGDENITVKHEEGSQDYQVTLNPDVTLKGDNSSIELNGTKGTMQVNQETAEGTNFTNINGNVVSIGYTNSEGIENAIVIDGGKGTITGLSNTTWDDELAKQVADSEELQGTAATQGQLQQAVSEVATEAGKHTIVSTPNDSNLTVTNIAKAGEAANYQVTLNDDITLGDKESTSITLYTDPTSETTVVGTDGNTTNVTGYVPESYKSGTGADFVKNNGGFALFTTDTQGHGIFGVTTKGTAHGKDFVTYTKDIYGNDTRYSLNDVGDAVAQMSSYYNEENRKSYTVFSRYLNEAEKDNPFVTVDEDGNKINATRDIPLALRDDGAVLIGATIKGEDFTDNGIRINAETKTTYDENGNEVTNNIATITGLENTEWKPKAPEQTPQAKMATFAANDETTTTTTTTSRAATEAQLDDLYNVVSVYNTFDNNGNVNYNTIKLRGDEYSYNEKNPVDSKGTSITNVAYASGTDGSEAVNVDYLNDAINNAVKDGGAISDSDRHLQEGTYHVNDQGEVELIVADEKGENRSTVTIDNIANKNDITNLDNKIDNTFNDLNDKINNIDNVETDVKGGNINEDGTISLKTENEDGTTTNVTLKGQLTDSGVVQEGTSFDKETGTITITSQDKYSGETSSVKVEGIASTEVVGATNKEDLATAYKDADKDGNATTEYITDSESMVEADVALDHAIQDVAGTSYANDMVLSNRIDSVEKRLGNVEERIDKVGAMAAAIANLRTMGFDPEAPTEIAIGVGQYKSETGIAIGVFHYPNQDFMLSASLSSSGDELMGGIGATWKLGRKSAAERAKDEEARHLEQAEEMKKLAQQEKVKAQAQRHAKLLAERQQASQKNA